MTSISSASRYIDLASGHCLLAADDEALDNLRVIVHDAIDVLQQQIGEATLDRVNLYFPDPWPKKRHHKRRIVQPAFIDLIASRLKPGGSLHIATDWRSEHIDEVLDASRGFQLAERREHCGDRPLDRPTTKFERRGLGQRPQNRRLAPAPYLVKWIKRLPDPPKAVSKLDPKIRLAPAAESSIKELTATRTGSR